MCFFPMAKSSRPLSPTVWKLPLSNGTCHGGHGPPNTDRDIHTSWLESLQQHQFGNPIVNYKTDLPRGKRRKDNVERAMKIQRTTWPENEMFSKSN
jgi:hypothetical protein